jgi:hypothetical protein
MIIFTISRRRIAQYLAVVCIFAAVLVVAPKPSYAATTLRTLQFTAQVLNTISPAKSLTLSGVGSYTISISGDFVQTNRCSGGARGWICEVTVAFHPRATGDHFGALSIGDTHVDLIGHGVDATLSIQTVAMYQRIIAPYIASPAHRAAIQYVAERSELETFLRELQGGRDRTLYQEVDSNLALVGQANDCLKLAASSSSISTSCKVVLGSSISLDTYQLQQVLQKENQSLTTMANVIKKMHEAADNIIKNINDSCVTSEC